jgi:hypothetical protein
MRAVTALAVLITVALGGCAGSSEDPDTATTIEATTTSVHTSTTATPATTASPDTTTTSTVQQTPSEPGGEAITVTEKITITVTDPED